MFRPAHVAAQHRDALKILMITSYTECCGEQPVPRPRKPFGKGVSPIDRRADRGDLKLLVPVALLHPQVRSGCRGASCAQGLV